MVSQTVDKIISAEKQADKMADEAYKKSEEIISEANEKAKDIINNSNLDVKTEVDNLLQNNKARINEIFENSKKATLEKDLEIRAIAQQKKGKAIDIAISKIISK